MQNCAGKRQPVRWIGPALLGKEVKSLGILIGRYVELCPAMNALCRVVDESYAAFRVGDDHAFGQLAENGGALGGQRLGALACFRQSFFRRPLAGAIAENLEEAGLAAICQRQHDARSPETRTVLAHVPALVRRAPLRPRQRHLLFRRIPGPILGREEYVSRLSQRFVFPVTEQALRASVPPGDPPGRIERDDGVFLGAVKDVPKALLALAQRLFGLLAGRNVDRRRNCAGRFAVAAAQRRSAEKDGRASAVGIAKLEFLLLDLLAARRALQGKLVRTKDLSSAANHQRRAFALRRAKRKIGVFARPEHCGRLPIAGSVDDIAVMREPDAGGRSFQHGLQLLGTLPERLLGLLQPGDVHSNTERADWNAFSIANILAPRENPAGGSVGPDDPEFPLDIRHGPVLELPFAKLLQPLPVFGMMELPDGFGVE